MEQQPGPVLQLQIDRTGQIHVPYGHLTTRSSLPFKIVNPLNGCQDFSLLFRLRGAPQARQHPLLATLIDEQIRWQLGIQENGSWFWEARQGESAYSYHPTPARQPILDEEWHQLACCFSARRAEIWLYYDGLNVAIYHLDALPNLTSAEYLLIGDEHQGLEYELSFYARMLGAEELAAPRHQPPICGDTLHVMTFNIWNGGRETGKEQGVDRTIELIQQANADIITIQETYGSGPRIAEALGYYFYLRSRNLSIMSRYPILSTVPVFDPFFSGCARIALRSDLSLHCLNIWLHYLPDYLGDIKAGRPFTIQQFLAGENQYRFPEITQILRTAHRLPEPILIGGDFNSGSHLDWIDTTAPQHGGHVLPWPVSKAMEQAGFRDSYREIHPDPLAEPGYTWSPIAPADPHDRIDYIYYRNTTQRGATLQPLASLVIESHPERYPSDHGAVLTTFRIIDGDA
ncbi:exonuclease III [Thermosporothrix hazakensis]|jgi:exonuclease III|uniref:Exonuclease III n=1 Tax=Thermosporothrix hazakensis TaxID=644383 RepID=A0A326UNB9_THEHA|nr:endonuclease/exonuclease/phosphatase family protein [Thermosporothrix hazakensis]PZW31265.1 exonuclease III [Thermosporothrix hazakensis]GCE50821.1 hypothetical protein KTH_56900 [Thermosporothrix hazakensis]